MLRMMYEDDEFGRGEGYEVYSEVDCNLALNQQERSLIFHKYQQKSNHA